MQEVTTKDISMHCYERLTLLGAEGPGVQLILLQITQAARSKKAKGATDIVTKYSRC